MCISSAQASEPSFNEVIAELQAEVSSDGGTIDGLISHYGGSPPESVSSDLDRFLGEQAAINSEYGGRTAMTASMDTTEVVDALGVEGDETLTKWLESDGNAASIDTDAEGIDNTLTSIPSEGATELAAGGEAADVAAGAGVLPAIGSFATGWFVPGTLAFIAGYAIGSEFMNLIGGGQEGEEALYKASSAEAVRWEAVRPGEYWGEGIGKDFAKEEGYEIEGDGPGADGHPGCFYTCGGEPKNETSQDEYVMVFRDPCYFSASCSYKYYDDAMAYTYEGGPKSEFIKPDLFSCLEYPFTNPEVEGWPPVLSGIAYNISNVITNQEGCKLGTGEWVHISFEGVGVSETDASLKFSFPRSSKTPEVTYKELKTKPVIGNEGLSKGLKGQNEVIKYGPLPNIVKIIDHGEKRHTGPKETIPLLPGIVTELAKTLEEKNEKLKELGDTGVSHIAEECAVDQLEAGLSESTAISNCENLPLFLSGSDVPEATEHDLKAINPFEGGEPAWVALNYKSAETKEANGEKRNWYVGLGGCSGEKPEGDQCDEYPFFASAQGGPGALVMPSLQYIDEHDNTEQGRKYGSFVTSCKMAEKAGTDYLFLAIPLPPALGIPTTYACN